MGYLTYLVMILVGVFAVLIIMGFVAACARVDKWSKRHGK